MPAWLLHATVAFGSIFSIVDPFSAVPAFVALTGRQSQRARNRTALRAAMTCFGVLTVFSLAGGLIFSFFSITLAAFKIAGGVLLFGVGLEMMRARHSETRTTPEEEEEAETKEDVGLIPLGLPLLSGPGAIATAMVLAGKAVNWTERVTVYVAIFATAFASFLVLRSSVLFVRVLGRTGLNVISRLMGLILAAIAVQFVIDGVQDAFPRLR